MTRKTCEPGGIRNVRAPMAAASALRMFWTSAMARSAASLEFAEITIVRFVRSLASASPGMWMLAPVRACRPSTVAPLWPITRPTLPSGMVMWLVVWAPPGSKAPEPPLSGSSPGKCFLLPSSEQHEIAARVFWAEDELAVKAHVAFKTKSQHNELSLGESSGKVQIEGGRRYNATNRANVLAHRKKNVELIMDKKWTEASMRFPSDKRHERYPTKTAVKKHRIDSERCRNSATNLMRRPA